MRGDTVIVRAFGGKPLILKVWSVGARVVYLTDEGGIEKMQAGAEIIPPLGFPKEDVFKYEPEAAANLKRVNWAKLAPYLSSNS
jgi:hypothetical protein